jgi:hypothetical protein
MIPDGRLLSRPAVDGDVSRSHNKTGLAHHVKVFITSTKTRGEVVEHAVAGTQVPGSSWAGERTEESVWSSLEYLKRHISVGPHTAG